MNKRKALKDNIEYLIELRTSHDKNLSNPLTFSEVTTLKGILVMMQTLEEQDKKGVEQ